MRPRDVFTISLDPKYNIGELIYSHWYDNRTSVYDWGSNGQRVDTVVPVDVTSNGEVTDKALESAFSAAIQAKKAAHQSKSDVHDTLFKTQLKDLEEWEKSGPSVWATNWLATLTAATGTETV
jgi:hypothetical protein